MSATLPEEVMEVTHNFMRDPVRVLVKREQLTLEGIRQFYIATDEESWKIGVLCDLYETIRVAQVAALPLDSDSTTVCHLLRDAPQG